MARSYVGAWLALVPALLVVSGSWMLTAAGLLTENAGLPLSAAALAATARRRLERPARAGESRRCCFALLAALARVQLAVLLPVIALAIAVDCARYWSDWRERLVAHRVLAAVERRADRGRRVAVLAAPGGTLGIYENFKGGARHGRLRQRAQGPAHGPARDVGGAAARDRRRGRRSPARPGATSASGRCSR